MINIKICVTGGAGYIGSRVVYDLIKAGHEVVGIDNFYLGQINEILGNKIINADIENLEQIEPLIKGCDAVFHLA
ncbi:MAG: NAD-dependent epimerase/dehydratase family protein, partial [Promethearchaeota archaeon]